MTQRLVKLLILCFLGSSINSCGPVLGLPELGLLMGAKDWITPEEAPLPTRKNNTTDPRFNSFVEAYRDSYRTQKNLPEAAPVPFDIPINFGKIEDENVIGVCFEYPDGTKEIIIKEYIWWKVNDPFRESLIFHELGHCHLGRAHDDEEIVVGESRFKKSVMHSILVNTFHYQIFGFQYKKELFTRESLDLEEAIHQIFGDRK